MGPNLYFLESLISLTIIHTIRPNTMMSPNARKKLPAPMIARIPVITAIASNTLSKIVNKIIIITPSIIQSVISANQISLRSKQVSHRSRLIGFIFKPHMIWRIVTVWYISSVGGPDRSSKMLLKFLCKYNSSASPSFRKKNRRARRPNC